MKTKYLFRCWVIAICITVINKSAAQSLAINGTNFVTHATIVSNSLTVEVNITGEIIWMRLKKKSSCPEFNLINQWLTSRPKLIVPTNQFCGIIKVIDLNRTEATCNFPQLVASNSYPELIDIKQLIDKSFFNGWHNGPAAYGRGLFDTDTNEVVDGICNFELSKIFQLTDSIKSNGCTIVVWPKIYCRTETNYNFYQRIDLAPVSTIIHVR